MKYLKFSAPKNERCSAIEVGAKKVLVESMMNFFSFFLSPFPGFSPRLVLEYTFVSTFFHWNQIHTSKIVTTKGTLIRKALPTEPPRSGQNELFTKFWQLYGSAFNDWDKIRRPEIRTSLLRVEKKNF